MSGINKAIIIGHLGKDPETRYMPNGDAVTNFTVATSETWKDKNSGEKKEKTEWHRIVTFGKLAEIVGQYAKKGGLIYLCGRLQTREWQDKDGNKKYTTEIIAAEVQFLSSKERTDGRQESQALPERAVDAMGADDLDVPF